MDWWVRILILYRHSRMLLAGEVVQGSTVYEAKDEIHLQTDRFRHAGEVVQGSTVYESKDEMTSFSSDDLDKI